MAIAMPAYEEIPPSTEEIPGPLSAASLLGGLRERLLRRQSAYQVNGLVGLATGLPTLDRTLQGLQPGRVYLLAAPPKLGKSLLANRIAGSVAAGGTPALYVTFELAPEDLAEAHVCRLGGVSIAKARAGMLGPVELHHWEDGAARVAALSALYYQQGTTRTTLDVVAAALATLRVRHDAETALLVVDYLQKWAIGGGGFGDQRARVQALSAQLTELASAERVPVLAIVSLARAGYGEKARGSANVATLKEAGELEYDASAVLFLREPEQAEGPPRIAAPGARVLYLDVALNRYGEAREAIRLLVQRDLAEVGELETGR